jgi:hypothetical protein
MLNIGDTVRVLPPFADDFPGDRVITDIIHSGDGTTTYILGDAGGFDAVYLEAV